MVPSGDHHRISHSRHILDRLIQRITTSIQPQAQIDHRFNLLGSIGRIVSLPLLQQLLDPTKHRRRGPLAIGIQHLNGVNDGRLGRAVRPSRGNAGNVRPVRRGGIVVRTASAGDSGPETGGAVATIPVRVIGVNARVEDVDVGVGAN